MIKANIGVIGGSGLYQMDDLTVLETVCVETPFGNPSDDIIVGTFDNRVNVAFLPRHGRGHRLLPTEVPSRANIWALKSLGVETVLSVSAVGSLAEAIEPRHFIIPDQIIDRTKSRSHTFFGEGVVGHVGFADPFCGELSKIAADACETTGVHVHRGGTYVCMEGPLFSTRAESRLYRSWGAACIGMTALPEAKLAREAELCYATIAMATDYDCWHEEDVSVELVLEHMKHNIIHAKAAVKEAVLKIEAERERLAGCGCRSAAKFAIMTDRDRIPRETMHRLDLFYREYWS
jgi:5'-methylthioadenosine phosphorylase